MANLLYNMKLLSRINSTTVQTKCKLFCHNLFTCNKSPSISFLETLGLDLYIINLQFIQWNMYLVAEVLTFCLLILP